MNQILVSQKVYVTKEMKAKRKIYRILYIISVLTVITLLIYYVFAEKSRNDQEALSKEIMNNIQDNTTIEEHAIVIALDDNSDDSQAVPLEIPIQTNEEVESEVTTSNGKTYSTEAVFKYDKLGISYPVLTSESDELLKISLCKYWGPKPNEIGNYCIVGHNYKSGKMFGKLSMSKVGDEVSLADLNGNTVRYLVYNIYVVEPTDVSCTSQITNGKRELTLITCTNYGQQRLVVKAREI